MNNLLLNCILYAILVCPIKRTGSQSVELVLKTCQLTLNPNDLVTFEVFVNTTGATQELWPLDDIYLRNSWTSTSCHVNITRDGCGQVNESMCGYCERQDDGGFYLLFPRFQAQGYTYVDSVWEGKAGSKSNYWTFYSYELGPNAISYKYIGWDTYWSTVYSYLTGGFVQSFVRHELYLPRTLASSFRVGSKSGDFIKVSDTLYIQPTSTLQEDVVFVLTRTNCQFVCGPLSEQFKLEDLRLTFNKTLATISVVNQYYPAEKVKCQVFSGYIEVYLATSLSWQETACTFPVNETSGQETLPIEIRVFVPFLQSSCRPTELIKIESTTTYTGTTCKDNSSDLENHFLIIKVEILSARAVQQLGLKAVISDCIEPSATSMSLFKSVMQAARNDTEKIYCGWSNNRHATILRCSSITTDDIKLDDLPKYKLYVRLQLSEQAIPGFLLRKFVNSLLKTLKYDECLIFELNDAVASAICNELKFQEKTPLGILQDDIQKSKFSISGRHSCNLPMKCQMIRLNDKGNEKSVIYSYFKRLLLVPSLGKFKIDLAEDIYACDIIFKATKSVTGINNFARVYVEPASAALRYISLTFEEALDHVVLGHKIYEEVKRHYKITEGSKESFLLKMSMKCLNDKIPSQLNWSLEDIKDVVNVAVKDHRTTSLAQLLEGYDTKDKILLLLKEGYGLDESITDKKETVLLRKLLRNVHIKMNLDKQNGCMLLFINALVHKKFKASLFYWTQLDNLIGSALIASYFLKKCTNTEQDQAGLTKLKEYQNFYQDLAIGTLFACYKENILTTWILLIQQIPVWGNESCITIAMKTKNRQFVQQKACSDLNKYVWNNYKGLQLQDIEPESMFKTDETVAASKVTENIERFFLSPKGRCRLDSIGYILFLTAYSILLVSLLSAQQFHWLEGVVMFYMFIIIAREIDQVFQERGEYQLEIYNIFDLLSITLAVIAWTLRWVAYHYTDYPQIMDAARYVFSCDFIVYALRFTEYFYENKMLGPILVKIRKMVKIYIPFLFILFIFLVSYAVASESILYPETELNRYILYYIFRKGFWAMIGDYRLDEVEVSGDGCTRDPNLYRNHSVLRCPSISGRFAVPVFLGAYALFVQILMFSLIIALFNFAITRKEEQNEMIWRYQRFLLSEQYSRCRILLPPFIPLFFWLMFRVGQPYSSSFEESEAHSGIKEFENMAGQIITGKIIDGSFTTSNDDHFSDGDDDFNPNISHQDSRRASSIRKLNAGSRYRLSPRLTRRLRQSEKISKTESDESNGFYVNAEALPIPTLKDIVNEIKEEDETSFQGSDGHVTPSSETPGLSLSSPGAFHEQFSFLTQEATKQKKKAAKKSTELPSLPALFNTMERDVLY